MSPTWYSSMRLFKLSSIEAIVHLCTDQNNHTSYHWLIGQRSISYLAVILQLMSHTISFQLVVCILPLLQIGQESLGSLNLHLKPSQAKACKARFFKISSSRTKNGNVEYRNQAYNVVSPTCMFMHITTGTSMYAVHEELYSLFLCLTVVWHLCLTVV